MPVDLNNISNSNNSLGFNFDWKWFCADTTRKTKKYKRVTDYYPVIFVTEDIQIDSSNDF
jgi:hypothetical protein